MFRGTGDGLHYHVSREARPMLRTSAISFKTAGRLCRSTKASRFFPEKRLPFRRPLMLHWRLSGSNSMSNSKSLIDFWKTWRAVFWIFFDFSVESEAVEIFVNRFFIRFLSVNAYNSHSFRYWCISSRLASSKDAEDPSSEELSSACVPWDVIVAVFGFLIHSVTRRPNRAANSYLRPSISRACSSYACQSLSRDWDTGGSTRD